MTRRRVGRVIGLALSIVPLAAHGQQRDRAVGVWLGPLTVGQTTLRLQLTIRFDPAGALSGVMQSVDQRGVAMPADVTLRGDTVSFAIARENVSYRGVMNAAGDSIRGTFTQGRSFPLTFVRTIAGATSRRRQDPQPPFPYQSRDVTFESAPGIRLAGTIDVPAGAGPFPVVVFVTGSGPQDRNEEIAGHRPFLVIADYLARHGIASLRYDDRGTSQSTGDFATATTADFAVDAEAAVAFVKSLPGLASTIGILGHSEGGLIAPMVAAHSRDVGFVVLLAAPGVRDDSLVVLQNRAMAMVAGASREQVASSVEMNRRLLATVRDSRDSLDAVARLAAVKRDLIAALPEARRTAAAAPIEQFSSDLLRPWMRFFVKYDTRPALRQLHVPVLALGGSLDLQVPADENLAGIEASLKAAGNRDVQVVELPGLNHLFQHAHTGSPAEYATIDETVAPQVLEIIASWVNAHGGRGARRE